MLMYLLLFMAAFAEMFFPGFLSSLGQAVSLMSGG